MCGIFGDFRFDANIDVARAIDRVNLLSHRGPDGFGFAFGDVQQGSNYCFLNEQLAMEPPADVDFFLGHRRLSIVDLDEKALQPMQSRCGNYQIVFNGEIYNYPEIKQELAELGYEFTTDHSDTEALLNAFIAWGQDCLQKLVGMFAFAIFDRSKREVFLARDRIGQKPLYYSFSPSGLVFSSEITPILRFSDDRFDLDEQSLRLYLIFGYVPTPRTLFRQIRKLPAANYAWVDLASRTMRSGEYWDLEDAEDTSLAEEDWLRLVENGIHESVRLRLRADVPIGAFASGGIDSTLVVKSMSQLTDGPADAYSADFPKSTNHSQREHTEQVSATYGTKTRFHMIGMNLVQNYEDIIEVFDEPFDGGSSIALFELFRDAKRDKKVILTGDGGDELFAGYHRYASFFRMRRIKSALEKTGIGVPVLRFLNKWLKSRKVDSVLNLSVKDYVHRYDPELTKLLIDSTNGSDEDDYPEACTRVFNEGRRNTEKTIQYIDLKTLLPDRMLYKLDRFSMRYGIEARSPLLDHRVVELAHRIPASFNVNAKSTKLLLKRILSQDFDDGFLFRRKQGFGNPLSNWFENEDCKVMFKDLRDPESLVYRYLHYDRVQEMFPQILGEPSSDRCKKLWRLIVLANYLNRHSDCFRDEGRRRMNVEETEPAATSSLNR